MSGIVFVNLTHIMDVNCDMLNTTKVLGKLKKNKKHSHWKILRLVGLTDTHTGSVMTRWQLYQTMIWSKRLDSLYISKEFFMISLSKNSLSCASASIIRGRQSWSDANEPRY